MAIRSDFTSRPTTPPPEQKTFTDQEREDMLTKALGDMDEPEETGAHPLTSELPSPPIRPARFDAEEALVQMLRDLTSGNFDLSGIQKMIQQMVPNPEDLILQGVQSYQGRFTIF